MMETVTQSNFSSDFTSIKSKSRDKSKGVKPNKKMHLTEFHALYPDTPIKKSVDQSSESDKAENRPSRDDVDERWDVAVSKVVDSSVDQKPNKTKKKQRPMKGDKKKQRPMKGDKKNWETTDKKKPERANMRKPDQHDPSETVTLDEVEVTPSKTVILKHLPKEGVTERDLNFFFKKAGPVKDVKVIRNKDGTCKGVAFVEYYELTHATKALKFNRFWYEDQKVYVSYAVPRK